MEEYLYYILSTIGIGWFITESDLMKPIRMSVSTLNNKLEYPFKIVVDKLNGILNCIYCVSFWIAIGVYFIHYIDSELLHCVLSAFSVLGVIYIVKNILAKQ